MDDNEIIINAKLKLKYLLIVNVMVFVLALTGGYFGGINTFIYFFGFYVIEVLVFVGLFIPIFTFWLFKGRSIKISASKAVQSFGDFYHFITPW
ncbi:hypothetical protein [Methylomonas sp. ZR1]|uniref:hypothetical protein n=1 Tax=Methylomonas sp. ZR1 TaxID=1797072 RepID=UPI001493146D|nr:hypothetical protein [Methylomonas sp. ZR1]NOV29571.1 hypothetical protein [Methylomonas sp. ZR1]